jgi:imidazolonepropionase-like amidohydrolase
MSINEYKEGEKVMSYPSPPAVRSAGRAREDGSRAAFRRPRPGRGLLAAAGMTASLILASCASAAVGAQGSGEERTVLRNFTLIDGTGAAPVSDAAMIIEEGRIAWVGAANDLSAADSQGAMDLSGRHVMPGLMDIHVHLGNVMDMRQDGAFYTRERVEQELDVYAGYGVTTVLSLGTDNDLIFDLRAEQREGRPSTARVFTAGQGFVYEGGYGGLAGLNRPVSSVEEIETEMAHQAERGVDFIKIWLDDELGTMPKMPPELSQAIIDAAARYDIPVVVHVFYLEDAKRVLEQGAYGLAHSVRDEPADAELIDLMIESNSWLMAPTLTREISMFAYASPEELLGDHFFREGVSAVTLQVLENPEFQERVAANPHYQEYTEFFRMAQDNLRRLSESGVRVAFGTDSGPPGRFPGYFAHWELELMVEAGLSPGDALAAATGGAAALLGADDLGTLEAGNWADLVVLTDDPLADIRNTRSIEAVYIAGESVPVVVR